MVVNGASGPPPEAASHDPATRVALPKKDEEHQR